MMLQNIWCKFLRLHKYEILREEKLLDPRGNVIGIILINRCYNCGKIKQVIIHTEENGRY